MAILFPYLIAVLAISFYASLSPMAKKIGFNLPPFTLIACSSAIHLVIAGAVAFFIEKEKVIAGVDKIEWHWLVVFSLTNLVGYVLYLFALSRIPVAQYQIIGILMPVIGGLFAFILLKEPLHVRYLLALVFMAIGLYIAIAPDLKRG